MTEDDFPRPGALISLKEARRERRCRICGTRISDSGGMPDGWPDQFGEMLWPVALTLNYGREFAHTQCLKDLDG